MDHKPKKESPDKVVADEFVEQKTMTGGHFGPRRLFRSETDRILGGVCAGIAHYFNLDPTIVRIIFLILGFTGSGVFLYLILWFIIPSESDTSWLHETTLNKNMTDMKERAGQIGHDIRNGKSHNRQMFWGIILLFFGVMILFDNFNFFPFMQTGRLWPLIIIAAGVYFLLKKH